MMPLLDVRELTVRFPSPSGPVYAVDRLSLDVAAGEVLAVVGESGCGKSVLALSILGLVPPPGEVYGGPIRLGDADLRSLPPADLRAVRGKDIGMVFQEPVGSLNPVLTVGRQIGEVLQRHQGLSRRAARAHAIELLAEVEIPAPARRVDDYPHQLSGGMAQRVMIAIAIACRPRLLLADEPTTALDVTIQAGILRLLLGLRERLGMAIVLITHDLGVVAEVADRVMVMYAGRRVETAPVEALFAEPQHPYTAALLGAVRFPGRATQGARRRLPAIPGVVPVRHAPAAACVFAPRCARRDDRCDAELPELTSARVGHLVACFHPGPRSGTAAPSGAVR